MNIGYPGLDSSYAIPSVGWTSFDIDYVMVNGFPHRVAYAGNPEGVPVVLMSGVFEDDLSVFRWMIDEMIGLPNGGDFRFVMVTIPFFEEYAVPTYSMPPDFEVRYARFDGLDFVARKPVPQKGILPVDPRYDHGNQARTLYSILRGGLNIEKAHFIGHDRGAVIIDYLLGEYPELALSYSRGSQGWSRYDPGWAKLIDQGIMVGPPHGIFRTELAAPLLKMLFTTGFPVLVASPAWMVQAAVADADTEPGRRWATFQGMADRPADYYRRTRETFRQSDFAYEAERRADPDNPQSILKTSFPLMQFQSAEEMTAAADIPGAALIDEATNTYRFADLPGRLGCASNHTGDQPWFGKYNLFEDEVMNLLPETTFQAPGNPTWEANYARFVTEHAGGAYSTLQTKPEARMNRFALVPDCSHWSHIENPAGCARAIMDFIAEV